MLAYKNRFHGHGSLRYVYKNGTVERNKNFTLKSIKNKGRNHSRIAVVVSKKVCRSAVGRNRIRRRVYEIVRNEINQFSDVYDIAIIVTSNETQNSDIDTLKISIKQLISQAGLYGYSGDDGIL